ncbi:MAG: recombinase family protein [Pseudomonadota bacterium]
MYCRVSSAIQTKRGDGLASQETRCREFARAQGHPVVGVYRDDKTGSIMERPGMTALLAFLQQHRHEPHVVIIDDISRLARGMKAHLGLREAIARAGGILKSPSIEFADDADSELQELIMATVSQHQRRKNAEQTMNRMRARLSNGYWVFSCPIGYKRERVAGHGKLLVRDEPLASIVQEALEGYASGRFDTQAEVKRFLERFAEYPRDHLGEVRNQRVTEILTRVVYAGHVQHLPWGIALRPAQHEGLISLETFERIQERLRGKAKAPARKDLNADFPLRGFVLCDDCSTPLTACWSRSKTGARHPYYLCPTKGCPSYRKSIRRAVIEDQFAVLLRRLQPSETLFALVKAMFVDAWARRHEQAVCMAEGFRREAADSQRQIDKLLGLIVEASTPSVIAAYEARIADLEHTKALALEKAANNAQPRHTREELFELALAFLANPYKIWEKGCLSLRRLVLKLGFAERLNYRRGEGFRTPKTTLPFNVLETIQTHKSRLAHRGGRALLREINALTGNHPPNPFTIHQWLVAAVGTRLGVQHDQSDLCRPCGF